MVEAGPPDQPRRIAILLPSLNGGGAERVALFLVEVLVQAGYAVDLVVAVNHGSLVDHPVAQKYRVDLRAPNEMLCGPQIARYCRRARPDLLIAFVHTSKIMAGLTRKFVPDIPLALSVHAALDIPRRYRFWVRRWFGFGPERWLYRGVLGCHVVSMDLYAQVQARFAIPQDRVCLIHNPLPERHDMPSLPPGHEEWFDRPVLMTTGRLAWQKDQAALLHAFQRSGLAGTARLLILGEGALEERLRTLSKRLGLEGDVIFGGFQPDVRPYLVRATGFLLSSIFEGFPLVLEEALMAGLPVAAFDCPSGPREILEEGQLGRLLAPGDVDGLAAAMRDMVAGDLRPAEQDILAPSMQRFSTRRIAEAYIAFVEQCLDRRVSDSLLQNRRAMCQGEVNLSSQNLTGPSSGANVS